MKQIVFISGKGGTGKSTLVSSLSILVQDKMLADCDVDAPNLHILLKGELLKKDNYFGAKEAVIDSAACVKCGLCKETCRFNAISEEFEIIPMKCEGCGACILVCPQEAIRLEEVKTGETFVSGTSRGTFSHALLDIGAEGSGKLVTEVRKNIYNYKKNEKWVLIDGSPGIGCVVIASITGADAVVAVSEPTRSGKSDLERVLGVARHFGIPSFVCINKYNLNPEVTSEIEDFCRNEGFPVIGKIPFDPSIVKALQEFKTPIEAGNNAVTNEITSIWMRLTDEMKKFESV
ncbi:MAG: MinD superfamily P-loop ATPase containing an inserted ferredoxin domain [Firmicutes bacterium]|nr:MinD superfamily P-loop ATPase containing an inserted ferredoxin domain [Bacillota bacterium]